MNQLGHADPRLTLRVYAGVRSQGSGERQRGVVTGARPSAACPPLGPAAGTAGGPNRVSRYSRMRPAKRPD